MKNYLLEKKQELTSVGAVFVCILNISEVDNLQARLSKTCYRTFFAIQKAGQRKRELKVKFLDAQMFFSSSKHVRGLSTPMESLPL